MNPFGITDKSYKLIIETFLHYPEVEKVLIFGSRATGNYKKGSDINLAIQGKKCNEKTAMNLNAYLNEKIPVPYYFDVIDYNSLTHDDLKNHINRVGIDFIHWNKPILTNNTTS